MSALIITGMTSTEAVDAAQLVGDTPVLGEDVLSRLLSDETVALVRVPLPTNEGLTDLVLALQKLYGSDLRLMPFGREDEFASIVRFQR